MGVFLPRGCLPASACVATPRAWLRASVGGCAASALDAVRLADLLRGRTRAARVRATCCAEGWRSRRTPLPQGSCVKMVANALFGVLPPPDVPAVLLYCRSLRLSLCAEGGALRLRGQDDAAFAIWVRHVCIARDLGRMCSCSEPRVASRAFYLRRSYTLADHHHQALCISC